MYTPWLGVEVCKAGRPFSIDQGRGFERVLWRARRKSRPKVIGYGMTALEAVENLIYDVQPLGFRDYVIVGGNMFRRRSDVMRQMKSVVSYAKSSVVSLYQTISHI